MVEEAGGVGGYLEACADLGIIISFWSFYNGEVMKVDLGERVAYMVCVCVCTSASSFACSITSTVWPYVAQDIAVASPLRPAPTMII